MISEETKVRLSTSLSNLKDTLYNLLGYAERNVDTEERRLLRNLVLGLPDRTYATYQNEIDYLCQLSNQALPVFPYPEISPHSTCVGGVEEGFPYVIHKGNRLFFPSSSTLDEAQRNYLNYMDIEGLTGEGILRHSPHSYVSKSFAVEQDDIVLDIGSAEALFSLDNIGKASHIYMFECLKKWQRPLARTFTPFVDKVTIINKLVTGVNTRHGIRLTDIVTPRPSAVYFMKMDIEGYEMEVLSACKDFLTSNRIKLACCTYHRQGDADNICSYLQDLGYTSQFTEGYMLTTLNGIHHPYFRKGMIHARNF